MAAPVGYDTTAPRLPGLFLKPPHLPAASAGALFALSLLAGCACDARDGPGASADSALAAAFLPSPNHGERKGSRGRLHHLHYTGMASAKSALDLLRIPDRMSSHYFVDEDGTIFQLVPESRRAWHAGSGLEGRARPQLGFYRY